jgi:DNA polymerase-4
MPLVQAVKLCPQGVYLRGNMKRYREKSDETMEIFSNFAPAMQQLSIDEAFLDITGTEKLLGPPETLAKKLKETVRAKTGLTLSVGLASNKYVAKIASGMSKPDGLFYIPPGGEEDFMLSLPVTKIWGAGEKTRELFAKYNLKTCKDIHALEQEVLLSVFGNAFGGFLYRAVRGQPAETFDGERGTHSMSSERTFPYDLHDEFTIETMLLDICQDLIWRLLDCCWQSRTVSIKIRYGDFSTEGARETGETPVTTMNGLYERVLSLFRKKYQKGRGVRLIGAGLMNLETGGRQGELFDNRGEKERRLEKSILEINKKHPGAALRRGRSWLADK